jgi:hypothetical protein
MPGIERAPAGPDEETLNENVDHDAEFEPLSLQNSKAFSTSTDIAAFTSEKQTILFVVRFS